MRSSKIGTPIILNMSDNFFETYKAIQEFETEENVSWLNSDYGNLWPLLRNEVLGSFNPNYKKHIERTPIWRLLGALKRTIGPIILENKRIPAQSFYKNFDELWISSKERRLGGYNKYIDPYFKAFASKKALIVEKNNEMPLFYKIDSLNTRVLNYNSIYNYFNIINFINSLTSFKKIKQNKGLLKIVESFPHIPMYNLFISYSYFVNWYNFYTYFLSKFPALKKVYYTGNGTPDLFALIAAANALNVKTFEFQHGVISKHGIDYKYSIQNDSLFKLAPSCIFVYSAEAVNILEENTKGSIRIKKIENIALNNWKSKHKPSRKDAILFSLQNTVLPADHFIFPFFKYINQQHPNLSIILRLHPSHKHIKDKYQKILQKQGITYYSAIQRQYYFYSSG